MDELSPIFSRTTRKSRYSLYQSDYETAGEESDSSLYYSVLNDEDNESDTKNIENLMNHSNAPTSRRSLLGKCLLNQLKHTPHNEFKKRVSFNLLLKTTSPPAVVNKTTGSQTSSTLKLDTRQSLLSISMTQNETTAFNLRKSNSFQNIIILSDSETSIDSASNVALETTPDTDKDQSLNSTVVEKSNHQTGTTNEPTGKSPVCLENDVGLDVDVHVHERSDVTRPKNQKFSTTSRLSCLPVPSQKPIASSMCDLSNPYGRVKNPHLPFTSRSSKLLAYSTEIIGPSKPSGKTNIPKVASIGTNKKMVPSQRNSNNTTTQASVIPLFSLKCKYCDKSFAKKNILNVHLLEKCDKIPPNRYRQLLNHQDSSKI